MSLGPFISTLRPAGGALLAALLAAAAPAEAAEPALAAHRGVYDLVLDSRRPSRGVDDARGRILFEQSGNACEGFTTTFRQVVQLSVNGNQVVMEVRTANFEEGDGTGFRFTTRATENGRPRDETDGSATRGDGAVRLNIRRPQPLDRRIDGATLFPTEHMRRIVEAARAGQTILEAKVYDGADNGEKVYNATAIIGRRIAAGSGEMEEAARDPRLADLARWPVTISYFEDGKDSPAPAYSIAFELYENGVSRQLVVNYGEFSLRGTLARIEWLPETPCDR